ncbi:hypothetical protein Sjap_022438 [Stephania japonica]|uniref:Uncharacterized protein n=1 Tax=Stephania japonica TaxID=461633 RepID=A0AAP0EPE2_9MAGN
MRCYNLFMLDYVTHTLGLSIFFFSNLYALLRGKTFNACNMVLLEGTRQFIKHMLCLPPPSMFVLPSQPNSLTYRKVRQEISLRSS